MNRRKLYEEFEQQWLSNLAMKSSDTKGRVYKEPLCDFRTEFQRDRDRIIHSKSFRRLKHKTQVFLSPEGDHYRTRLTHTLEVAQVSRTIARALRLNEDLTEAITLGHDLGHTPFGHSGEAILDEIHPGGFKHGIQSLRVVEYLENKKNKPYRGLNLTHEVRDGIIKHNGLEDPITLEGQIVKICDRIAYINHDIDDAIRAGILDNNSVPEAFFEVLGKTHSERIDNMIGDIISFSEGKNFISMSPTILETTLALRAFMFENVYLNLNAKTEEFRAQRLVKMIYEYYANNPEKLPEEYLENYNNGDGIEAVKDYVAGMTDRYAVNLFKELYVPKFWK